MTQDYNKLCYRLDLDIKSLKFLLKVEAVLPLSCTVCGCHVLLNIPY